MSDLMQLYLEYTDETEPPKIFHRWALLVSIGALLGRKQFIQHGHFRKYPNLYTMFIGDPGTRKSTSIKMVKKLLSLSGYESFAAEKTSKEKFLLDLEGLTPDGVDADKDRAQRIYDQRMAEALWGDKANEFREPREVYIVADEFNEFAGVGNLEFYTTLGNMWDWDDDLRPFKQRLKNSKSISIWQPYVSILGGNTPENFARAFPTEILGQGFLSRMLLIYGEPSGKKYTFPPEPVQEKTEQLITVLSKFRNQVNGTGPISISRTGYKIFDSIYHGWTSIDDIRFKSYSNRRFDQLLKLSIICREICDHSEIKDETIIFANTILAAAERLMPKALGEFGKSKNSDISQKVLTIIESSSKAVTMKELWKEVHQDLERANMLAEITQNLVMAERIQLIPSMGYLPKRAVKKDLEFVDWSLLTEEERNML